VRVESSMLFDFLGYGRRVFTERFCDILHGHVLVKAFFNKYPVIKSEMLLVTEN